MANPRPAIVVAGQPVQSGAYFLRIDVARPIRLCFGAAAGGAAVLVPAGDYVYAGSAMGQRGPAALASRLLRHAVRSAARPPHSIYTQMLVAFEGCGLVGRAPQRKTVHWHVDYLLDHPAATLDTVCALRSLRRLERDLAELLEADTATFPVIPGLGASDHVGHTHLLGVTADAAWWQSVLAAATALADCSAKPGSPPG